MLKRLYIKNFTIIEGCEIDIRDAMTVLTGETGAGKSIIIDAIELALGARATSDTIRHGAERADIVIEFDVSNHRRLRDLLQMHELTHSEEELVMRRTITRDGRSKSFINDIPVTVPVLRAVGNALVHIHGQHEFQTLLDREEQLDLLDDCAKAESMRASLEKNYAEWVRAKAQYDALHRATKDQDARIDFLGFQLRELEAVHPQENEFEQIAAEHKKLAHADALLQAAHVALGALRGEEAEREAAYDLIHVAQKAMLDIRQVDDSLKNTETLLQNASVCVSEAADELNRFIEHIDNNPERLMVVEKRLSDLCELARKHHVAPEQLIALRSQLQQEYESLQGSDERLQQLDAEIQSLESVFTKDAKQLTALREKAAAVFSRKVTEHMKQLGMPGGTFRVELDNRFLPGEKGLHPKGNEKALFLVSINAGSPLQPLAKVASGGELSRISLAIQLIAAKRNKTPTLIFDEADIGIGGKTAECVGRYLRELGETTQTICITHLPQVAAKGHHHLAVSKRESNRQTFAEIKHLDDKERVVEIARMSAGDTITKEAIAHAKAMLQEK